jgi:hypothetical protein
VARISNNNNQNLERCAAGYRAGGSGTSSSKTAFDAYLAWAQIRQIPRIAEVYRQAAAMIGADLHRGSLWAAAIRGTANVLTWIAYLLAALVFVLPWVVLMAWSLVYLTHIIISVLF